MGIDCIIVIFGVIYNGVIGVIEIFFINCFVGIILGYIWIVFNGVDVILFINFEILMFIVYGIYMVDVNCVNCDK